MYQENGAFFSTFGFQSRAIYTTDAYIGCNLLDAVFPAARCHSKLGNYNNELLVSEYSTLISTYVCECDPFLCFWLDYKCVISVSRYDAAISAMALKIF